MNPILLTLISLSVNNSVSLLKIVDCRLYVRWPINKICLQEYSGLRAQDLQEAKDQLLVETADMLSVPLFTAEALLRNHGQLFPRLSNSL